MDHPSESPPRLSVGTLMRFPLRLASMSSLGTRTQKTCPGNLLVTRKHRRCFANRATARDVCCASQLFAFLTLWRKRVRFAFRNSWVWRNIAPSTVPVLWAESGRRSSRMKSNAGPPGEPGSVDSTLWGIVRAELWHSQPITHLVENLGSSRWRATTWSLQRHLLFHTMAEPKLTA